METPIDICSLYRKDKDSRKNVVGSKSLKSMKKACEINRKKRLVHGIGSA